MTTFHYRVVIHYGEIALKGNNRRDFLRQQRINIRRRFAGYGLELPVRQAHGYFYIEVPSESVKLLPRIHDALKEVIGIVWYATTRFLPADLLYSDSGEPNYQIIEEHLTTFAREEYRADAAFCVRVNRADKQFPSTSPELERRFGSVIIEHSKWDRVNLEHPDCTFQIDIYPDGIYLYTEKLAGPGGLPVGVTGRVLALLSGGIDSPVASYLAAKRGCSVDFIHFTANLIQQEQAEQYKVSQLARDLSRYTLRSTLYLVPYTHFEFAALGTQLDYELVIFRRFMARTAQTLAGRLGALALVTGDNLAQVASQTLENMVSSTKAVEIPILRPLLTYDKQEIVNLAKSINTYQLSIQPYKDCCSLISQHPRTKSKHSTLSSIEDSHLGDYQQLVDDTLEEAVSLVYEGGQRVT